MAEQASDPTAAAAFIDSQLAVEPAEITPIFAAMARLGEMLPVALDDGRRTELSKRLQSSSPEYRRGSPRTWSPIPPTMPLFSQW
jgi:hypothetical protein